MHVAITGASSGIGEALARELGGGGASLTLVARRRERLIDVARAMPGRANVVAADLGDPKAAVEWIAQAEAAFGPIDVLVNNAGVQIVAPTVEIADDDAGRLLDLDLVVPLKLIRAVLPSMLARRAGTIVNVASLAALGPTPGMTHYNAAKAGLAAASESLRGELRKSGVHVVTVYPGPVDTAMSAAGFASYPPSAGTRLLPEGRPEVLARRVRRAIERRRARVIYPRAYALARWFPTVTRWLLDVSTPAPYSLAAPERQLDRQAPPKSLAAHK